MKELKELEKAHPELFDERSISIKIGTSASEKFKKTAHLKKMASLNNAFNDLEIREFHDNIAKILQNSDIEYILEPKVDGLSLSLVYQDQKLNRAITRGDGSVGEDVSANASAIKSVKLDLKSNVGEIIDIRGEVYISKRNFETLNFLNANENLPPFANPRNAASGTLRQLDSSIAEKRNLDFIAYYASSNERSFNTHTECLSTLDQLGFKTTSQWVKKATGIENLLKLIKDYDRDSLPFIIDGIVIKVNNYDYYQKIGETSKFPKWAIAYKFSAEVKETKLRKIFPTVGRTGKITYNAILEPVELSSTNVSAATLHNAEYIESLDIRENDIVEVYKAGGNHP